VDDTTIKGAIIDIKNNLDNINFEDKTSFLQLLINYCDSGLLIDTNNYNNAYRNVSGKINSYFITDSVKLSSSNDVFIYENVPYYKFIVSNDESHIYGFRINENLNPEIIKVENTFSSGGIISNPSNPYVTFTTNCIYTIFVDNTTNPTIDDVTIRIYKQSSSDNEFETITQNVDELKTYYNMNTISSSNLNYSIVKDNENNISTKSILVQESISETINYYKLIGFWENEMMAVTSLYELAAEDGIELTSEIGIKLDKILNNSNPALNSKLITNQVLKDLIANKLTDLIHLDGTDSISNAVNTQITNISNNLKIEDATDANYINIVSWEGEFDGLIKLKDIDFKNVSLDSFDYEDTTDKYEKNLGVGFTLDNLIKDSNIVKFENIKAIIIEVIDSKIAELPTDKFGDDIKTNIQTNLNNYDISSYNSSNFSNEFSCINVLISLKDIIPNNYTEILDDTTLTSISKRLDLTKDSFIAGEIGIDIMNYLVDEIKTANEENLLKLMKEKFDTDSDEEVLEDFNIIFDTITTNIDSFGEFDGDSYSNFFDNMIPLKDVFVEIDNFSNIEGTPTQDEIDQCNNAIDKLSNNILLENVDNGSTQQVMDILRKYFKI